MIDVQRYRGALTTIICLILESSGDSKGHERRQGLLTSCLLASLGAGNLPDFNKTDVAIFDHIDALNFGTQIRDLVPADAPVVAALLLQMSGLIGKIGINLTQILAAPRTGAAAPAAIAPVGVPAVADLSLARTAALAGKVNFRTSYSGKEMDLLRNTLEGVVEQFGGEVTVTNAPVANTLLIFVSGALNMIYSVYSTFKEGELRERGANEAEFTVSRDFLQRKLIEKSMLVFVGNYLQKMGYAIQPGQKTAEQVFAESDEFRQSNSRGFTERFGISLVIGQRLHAMRGAVVLLPFAVTIETYSDPLMLDLEGCFKEAGLNAMDGQPKTFLLPTRASGKLHQANLAALQAAKLYRYFEQRAMLLGATGQRIEIFFKDKNVAHMIALIRGGQLKMLEDLLATNSSRTDVLQRGQALCAAPTSSTEVVSARTGGGLASYRGGASSPRAMIQEEFVAALDALVNTNFVVGPEAFRMLPGGLLPEELGAPSAAAAHSLAGTAARPVQAAAGYSSSLVISLCALPGAIVPAGVNPNPNPFAVAASAGGATSLVPYQVGYTQENTLSRLPSMALLLRGLDPRLDASTLTRVRAQIGQGTAGRLLEIRSFFKFHTPFYFVQTMFNRLKEYLSSAKEDQITSMLVALGVAEEQLNCYKITCDGLWRYNIYHIEFSLPVLVVRACLANSIIINPKMEALPSSPLQQYCYDPQNREQSKNNSDFQRALEWNVDRVYSCGWAPSTASVDRSQQSHGGGGYGGSTNTGLGGSYSAPPVRQAPPPSKNSDT